MLAGQPVIVLKEGSERAEGEEARRRVLRAARAAADALRTTLGPRGLDKMLVDSVGDVVITNDGSTILQRMEVDHPAAKILAEVARAQDQECGDGTKTAALLTGELLRRAEDLLDQKIHPTAIVQGYQRAAEEAVAILHDLGRPVVPGDAELLHQVAVTSMVSKGVSAHREFLAGLAVRAAIAVADRREGRLAFDRKNVQWVKRAGGEISESELLEGHIVERARVNPAMPARVEDARLALLELPLEVRKTEFAAEIRISETAQLQSFVEEEDRLLRTLADTVVASGATAVFVEKGIADVVAEQLARHGVYAVARTPRTNLELLARASGARLVARAEDLGPSVLGRAARVEERKVGEDRLTVVTGCPHARAVTLLVRGGAAHVADEAERSLVDAVSTVGVALEDGQVLTGAGATWVELGGRLREFSDTIAGREQVAVRAFADALETIPETLAVNAGMDPIDTLVSLRQRHRSGERDCGVNVLERKVGDMSATAIEPARLQRQVLRGATEAATILLRIDDVISARRTSGPARSPSGGPTARPTSEE